MYILSLQELESPSSSTAPIRQISLVPELVLPVVAVQPVVFAPPVDVADQEDGALPPVDVLTPVPLVSLTSTAEGDRREENAEEEEQLVFVTLDVRHGAFDTNLFYHHMVMI